VGFMFTKKVRVLRRWQYLAEFACALPYILSLTLVDL